MNKRYPAHLISGKSPHLYVTRRAALEYQALTGAGFEASRRILTERLLNGAKPDPERPGTFFLDVQTPKGICQVRAYTEREGRLLVIPSIAVTDTGRDEQLFLFDQP